MARQLLVCCAVAFVLLAATSAVALDNGVGLTPPLGWTTWCGEGPCGNDYCSEQAVMEGAEALKSNGMQALGYNWVLLDDCWAATSRTASGDLTWDTERFPSGIPALIEWLHARNLKFGLYTSAGNVTCSSGGRPHPVPGSEHHYARDANTFASWQVDYVKVDWCGDVKNMPLDGLMVGGKDYKAFSTALTNSTPKRNMFFEGVAAYIFLLGTVNSYVNSWRAAVDHHDNWRNTMEVVDIVKLAGKPGAIGAWSYMDVLMTGGQGCAGPNEHNSTVHCPGMTDIEYLSEFTLWSLYQSPLLVSTDVRNMTAVMQRILLNKRILSIHQDTRTPPGKHVGGDPSCTSEHGAGTCQFYLRPLADGSALLALFNAGELAHDMTFHFEYIPGWAPSATAIIEDLWRNTTSTAKSAYKATVEPHGVSYVVLTPWATSNVRIR